MRSAFGLICLTSILFVAAVCGGDALDAASSGAAAGNEGTGGSKVGSGGAGGVGPQTVAECYKGVFANLLPNGGPNYDQFNPIVGSHCLGTNHQDITGVQRVVFLGDSVTVGTLPTWSNNYYRSRLATGLAAKFGLNAPSFLWKTVNPFYGISLRQDDGAFSSCAKLGARTDDLVPTQLPNCFPPNRLDEKTLVVMTIGSNDINKLTQNSIDGVPETELWQQTMDFVQNQRDGLDWLLKPGRFANGIYVVFGNILEFTDGTGDVESCDLSGLAGFDGPIPQPEQFADMVIWANEQFVKMAVDTGTDVIFLLEEFCGHGMKAADPSAVCYRGPGNATWFDLTCIHPNPTGHGVVSDMFMAVVNE